MKKYVEINTSAGQKVDVCDDSVLGSEDYYEEEWHYKPARARMQELEQEFNDTVNNPITLVEIERVSSEVLCEIFEKERSEGNKGKWIKVDDIFKLFPDDERSNVVWGFQCFKKNGLIEVKQSHTSRCINALEFDECKIKHEALRQAILDMRWELKEEMKAAEWEGFMEELNYERSIAWSEALGIAACEARIRAEEYDSR